MNNKYFGILMLITLLFTFISGFLCKISPNMIFGIMHGVSSLMLLFMTLMHVFKYKALFKGKRV